MDLPLPKMGRELGAKVGGIKFIPWKSRGNKFSDRCQKFYCIVKKKSGVTFFFYCIEKKKCIGVKRKVESLSFFFSSCQKIYCIEKRKVVSLSFFFSSCQKFYCIEKRKVESLFFFSCSFFTQLSRLPSDNSHSLTVAAVIFSYFPMSRNWKCCYSYFPMSRNWKLLCIYTGLFWGVNGHLPSFFSSFFLLYFFSVFW
jgi:hypothetical protein